MDWILYEFTSDAPDLRLMNSDHPTGVEVKIMGFGLSRVSIRIKNDQIKDVASCMTAITMVTARGYPRPPLHIVREFMALNEFDWK